jgi:hypothetical protein
MTNAQWFQSLKSSPRHNRTQESDMRAPAGVFEGFIGGADMVLVERAWGEGAGAKQGKNF